MFQCQKVPNAVQRNHINYKHIAWILHILQQHADTPAHIVSIICESRYKWSSLKWLDVKTDDVKTQLLSSIHKAPEDYATGWHALKWLGNSTQTQVCLWKRHNKTVLSETQACTFYFHNFGMSVYLQETSDPCHPCLLSHIQSSVMHSYLHTCNWSASFLEACFVWDYIRYYLLLKWIIMRYYY